MAFDDYPDLNSPNVVKVLRSINEERPDEPQATSVGLGLNGMQDQPDSSSLFSYSSLPARSGAEDAQDFKGFFSSLPLGVRHSMLMSGNVGPLAAQFQGQRQALALRLKQDEEAARQHDLQLFEKAMANPKAKLMFEAMSKDPNYRYARQAGMMGRVMKDADVGSFQAYREFIPQEIQQAFINGQLPEHELTSWIDMARESAKVNAKEGAKATLIQRALNKSADQRTPFENKLIEEREAALELKNADIGLKKAQAKKALMEAERGPVDHSVLNRVHEKITGGKPYEQGTPATQSAALNEYFQGYAQGRTNVQMGTPAKVEERSNLINRQAFMKEDRLEQPPPGATTGQVRTGDYVEMTDKQREEWSGIVNSGATLSTLFNLAEPLITATSPATAMKQYAKLSVGAVSKTNPAAATYLADSEAFSSRMARVFGSEVGVLTQGDVNRWQRALPTFGDTKQVLAEKKKIFMSIYQQTKQMYKKKIAGEDFSEDLVRLRNTDLKAADKLSIPNLSTDQQFDILMGK